MNEENPKMTLKSVTNGGVMLPPRLMVYGVDGIGKSTFAAGALKPIFIPTEDGATGIKVPQFPLCGKWFDVFDALSALGTTNHPYNTVVIDSADWAQTLAIEHIIANNYGGDMDAFDNYGRGYKVLMQEFRKLMVWLDRLHKVKKMGVILISHSSVKTFKNPAGDDWDRYQSNLVDTPATSIWGMVKEWCDIVLFMNYDVIVRKTSAKATKGKGIMTDGQRACHAAPSAAWDAKVRAGWNLPDEFELDYKVYRDLLSGKAKKKGAA